MIVFAGIVPASPLLLESINPEGLPLLERTRQALHEVAEDLAATHPDTIVILAEQATMYPDAFSINVADPYLARLEAFGDLGYRKQYHPDFALVDKLQRELRALGEPVSLSTDQAISHLTVVPLDFLTQHLPNVRIIPIAPSNLDPKEHFNFGNALRSILQASSKRIAVFAAGDTAHALNEDSPLPAHEDGKRFDQTLVELVENRNTVGLLGMPPELVENAKDGVYRQSVMLFGVLEGMAATPVIHCYEAPLGVGHLVAEFRLD
ncbi:MAG: hypothetical protein NUV56_04765 [Candidatus Uhrbacteria bacterium]|nr:hypothetical protein [Candidatus Uhrbacteria bacterium]